MMNLTQQAILTACVLKKRKQQEDEEKRKLEEEKDTSLTQSEIQIMKRNYDEQVLLVTFSPLENINGLNV